MILFMKLSTAMGNLEGFLAWRTRRRGLDRVPPGDGAQELYAALIKDHISPALRSLGLVGSGGRYSLPSETHWSRIGFQKSAYSDRQEIRFTVNLLVVSRNAWDEFRLQNPHIGKEPSATIWYGSPVATTRLGTLMPDQEDQWWQVGPAFDSALTAQDVILNLERYGLPWLRARMSQPDA